MGNGGGGGWVRGGNHISGKGTAIFNSSNSGRSLAYFGKRKAEVAIEYLGGKRVTRGDGRGRQGPQEQAFYLHCYRKAMLGFKQETDTILNS